jgi:hypothetical protein
MFGDPTPRPNPWERTGLSPPASQGREGFPRAHPLHSCTRRHFLSLAHPTSHPLSCSWGQLLGRGRRRGRPLRGDSQGGREPRHHEHGGELSDLESDLVGRQKTGCSSSPAATTPAAELIVPPAQQIQQFQVKRREPIGAC